MKKSLKSTVLDHKLFYQPASDPGSAAVWGSKRINPRPQCLAWSGCPSNDDDDDELFYFVLFTQLFSAMTSSEVSFFPPILCKPKVTYFLLHYVILADNDII